MNELGVAEFDRVRPLLKDIDHQRPAVFTVLEGTQKGRVFADRRGRPLAALIWSDACYLAGSASNAAFNAALLVWPATSSPSGAVSTMLPRVNLPKS
jgi:hypothetical protein